MTFSIPTTEASLLCAISGVPAGSWAVGVSGGADSVALLSLLRERALARGDLQLHVVHLDHQTRGDESAADAAFVAELAAQWELPSTISTRTRVEAGLTTVQTNPSARYRQARLALFREVIAANRLQGVILAHHADDQAETIFQRLLRGGSFVGLGGMAADRIVAGVRVVRPLLAVTGSQLRQWLTDHGMAWREDASNRSPKYQRNRVRSMLRTFTGLAADAVTLGAACARLTAWTESHCPRLAEQFATAELLDLPELLAAHAVRRWLTVRGAAAGEISPATVERLLTMARDPASPPRQHFPGRVLVRRRRGVMWAESEPEKTSLHSPPSPGTPGEGRGEGSARPARIINSMPPRAEPSP